MTTTPSRSSLVFLKGWKAFLAGKPKTSAPPKTDAPTKNRAAWSKGWEAAEKDATAKQRPYAIWSFLLLCAAVAILVPAYLSSFDDRTLTLVFGCTFLAKAVACFVLAVRQGSEPRTATGHSHLSTPPKK